MKTREKIGVAAAGIGAAGLLYFLFTTVLATFESNPLFSIPLIITFLAIAYAIIRAVLSGSRKK
jgi:hypothetical protein